MCVCLMVRSFLWYQGQGHLSMSLSNTKVTFEKMVVKGALVFHKHAFLAPLDKGQQAYVTSRCTLWGYPSVC